MIEHFVLRLLPWWVFALVALCMLPLTGEIYRSSRETTAELVALRDAPQPPVVPIAAFDPARDVHALGEVNVSGIWRTDLGEVEFEEKGVNHSYMLLSGADDSSAVIALHFPSYERESIINYLEANADAEGRVTIGGFGVSSFSDRNRIEKDLLQRGLTALAIVEPFIGSRAAAIDDKSETEAFFFPVMAIANALFALVALWKFRKWRKRVAAKRPQAAEIAAPKDRRKATVAADTPAPTPPTPAKKDFAEGPIVSKKGFFR
jgi:hypothetical protein